MLPANTVLKGRYRIIQQLGAGGMGAVYQAMDENVSCLVAVKETFAEKEEYRRAFRREAQLLANLTHPTLPHVMDHFTHDSGQFLVMQFVPGNDLAELLALRERPFATDKVLEWADQLLDALQELHSYNPPIIHRDIKPSNLKLTPKGKIILLDFGLAKGAVGQMSTAGGGKSGMSVVGFTRHYAPLEQIRGIGTDPRSDLYSLGATLWSLLTGEWPPDALARVDEKEQGNPDPLLLASEKNSEVTQVVAAVVHQAMALNRNQRPANAAEMRWMLKDAARQAELDAAEISRQRAEEEARRAAVRRQRREEKERQRQEVKARYLKELEKRQRASGKASIWMSVEERREAKEEAKRQQAAEEERKRADAPTTESATPEPGEPTLETLKAPPPEKIVPGDFDAPPAVTTRKPFYRHIVFLGLTFVIAVSVLIALILWAREKSGGQTVANNSQTSSSNSNPLIQKNPDTKTAGTPPAGTVERNSLGMEFVYVPAGSFKMGSERIMLGEDPVHQVTIPNGFYMGRYEVTQAQWRAVMGNNPSTFKGCDQCPVETVSWNDAQVFISKLNARGGNYTYRLPSEAEWEYACRAGTTTEFAFGDSLSSEQANFNGIYPYGDAPEGVNRRKTMPVGSFQSNAWGLYDMHGNVWEWCEDTYYEDYKGAPVDGSVWLSGWGRVFRGGEWSSFGTDLRSARRLWKSSYENSSGGGFRLIAVPPPTLPSTTTRGGTLVG